MAGLWLWAKPKNFCYYPPPPPTESARLTAIPENFCYYPPPTESGRPPEITENWPPPQKKILATPLLVDQKIQLDLLVDQNQNMSCEEFFQNCVGEGGLKTICEQTVTVTGCRSNSEPVQTERLYENRSNPSDMNELYLLWEKRERQESFVICTEERLSGIRKIMQQLQYKFGNMCRGKENIVTHQTTQQCMKRRQCFKYSAQLQCMTLVSQERR